MPLHLHSRSYTSTPQHLLHRRSHQESSRSYALTVKLTPHCHAERSIDHSQEVYGLQVDYIPQRPRQF